MLPPDSTTPTRAPCARGRWPDSTAAAATAPLGSTTIRPRWTRKRMAARTSASPTSRTSVRLLLRIGNVSAPGVVARMPSAIVGGRGDRHPLASAQRQVGVVGAVGLDAEDRHARKERAGHRRAAGHEPAAADRRQQHVERGHVLEQLQRRRPLPGHDGRVVVGRHQHAAAALDDLAYELLAIVGQPVVEHDLGAVVARGLQLERRHVLGHADDRRRAHHPGRQRHALGVIARGERHDVPRALGRRQHQQLVQRAADLEGARPL